MPHPYTVGIDLGDRTSRLCTLDPEGEVTEESRIRTTPAALRLRFEALSPSRVVLEVGTHSAWVSRLLRELGHDVIVANARKLRFIYENESKSDPVDAEALARVGRLDPKLLAPVRHRSREAQADLALIRSRDVLVRSRARLISHAAAPSKAPEPACQDAPRPPSPTRLSLLYRQSCANRSLRFSKPSTSWTSGSARSIA